MLTPLDVLQTFLAGAFSLDTLRGVVDRTVHDDATYISLNFDNPDLARIEPWCGTKHGREAFVANFTGVLTQWELTTFEPRMTMQQDEDAMVFGKFSLRSRTLGIETSSPMCAIATVRDDRISQFIYLEDTLATASTFRAGGTWIISARPGEPGFAV